MPPFRRAADFVRHTTIVALGVAAASAQAADTASPAATAPQLEAALQRLVEHPHLAGASLGVHVVERTDSGTNWTESAAHRAEFGLLPASNLKLFTAVVALDTLGADHRFRTRLVATGPIGDDGDVDGDLILVGGGDPSFGDPDSTNGDALDRLLDDAFGTGVRTGSIRGGVYGDDDFLAEGELGDGWSWQDEGLSYAPLFSGLCWRANRLVLEIRPGAEIGAAASVCVLEPVSFAAVVRNDVQTVAADATSSVSAWRRAGRDELSAAGVMPLDAAPQHARIAVADPTRFAATALATALRARGIEVRGSVGDLDDLPPAPERYGDATTIAVSTSPTLADLLPRLLTDSDNLYGEQLLRVAARSAGNSGATHSSTAHARATLEQLGVDPTGLAIADGSGLSRLNVVRPAQLTSLLVHALERPWARAFVEAMPFAGAESGDGSEGGARGTLGDRFSGDSPARGRVVAKTGTMRRVAALSGYVFTDSATIEDMRPRFAFSLIVDHFSCTRPEALTALDEFVERLARLAGR